MTVRVSTDSDRVWEKIPVVMVGYLLQIFLPVEPRSPLHSHAVLIATSLTEDLRSFDEEFITWINKFEIHFCTCWIGSERPSAYLYFDSHAVVVQSKRAWANVHCCFCFLTIKTKESISINIRDNKTTKKGRSMKCLCVQSLSGTSGMSHNRGTV